MSDPCQPEPAPPDRVPTSARSVAKSALDATVVNIELTLISIIQGLALGVGLDERFQFDQRLSRPLRGAIELATVGRDLLGVLLQCARDGGPLLGHHRVCLFVEHACRDGLAHVLVERVIDHRLQ